MKTIEIADRFVEAFDSEHSQPIEFRKAAQQEAEEASQSGMTGSITLKISIKLAAYLERRANVVWESLKRAVLATGIEPYPSHFGDKFDRKKSQIA